MLIESVRKIFLRDLKKLKEEIAAYDDENKLWKVSGDIKNSAGNLCLHLCGNLQHFLGAVLGNTEYIRNREFEFSQQNVSRKDLLKSIDHTKEVVDKVISGMTDRDLYKNYPIDFFEKNPPVHFVILQLLVHLNYHMGQINYHRRLMG